MLIGVDLGVGDERDAGRWTVYGCDLTDGYVRISADYHLRSGRGRPRAVRPAADPGAIRDG